MFNSKKLDQIKAQGRLIFKASFLENLSKAERYEFLQLCHRRTYKAGEYIYYQGDPGTGMYLIEEGSIELIVDDDEGSHLSGSVYVTETKKEDGTGTGSSTGMGTSTGSGSATVTEAGIGPAPGKNPLKSFTLVSPEAFGMLSLSNEMRRLSSAKCIRDTVLLGFFRPDLERLQDRHPKIAIKLHDMLNILLSRQLHATIESLAKVSGSRYAYMLILDQFYGSQGSETGENTA
jgi:CRP-like cAMP-binding protein